MSVCAVMLVRDEADIIRHTIQHLALQVDAIYVADNGSTDGTREILEEAEAFGLCEVTDDPEVGYWQSRKTSALARGALAAGHTWVVPCDADEFWFAPPGKTVAQHLSAMGPDVQIVKAQILNHVPTSLDPDEPNPAKRIGWRLPDPGDLPKVACRAAADLTIGMGNHDASYDTGGKPFAVPGLTIHHYSWRTAEQYVRKIRNGAEAYAATDMDPAYGAHWRGPALETDDDLMARFDKWFWADEPEAKGLVYDPAPL